MMDTLWRAVSPRRPYSLSRRPLPRSHRGLRQRLDRRLVVRPWSSYLYISLSSSITLYLCLCSIAVTVIALHPPRLCRIAVLSLKPTSSQTKQREKQSLEHLEGATAFLVPNQLLFTLASLCEALF